MDERLKVGLEHGAFLCVTVEGLDLDVGKARRQGTVVVMLIWPLGVLNTYVERLSLLKEYWIVLLLIVVVPGHRVLLLLRMKSSLTSNVGPIIRVLWMVKVIAAVHES